MRRNQRRVPSAASNAWTPCGFLVVQYTVPAAAATEANPPFSSFTRQRTAPDSTSTAMSSLSTAKTVAPSTTGAERASESEFMGGATARSRGSRCPGP